MFSANYNNLGDIAITKAQTEFVKKCLPEYEVINITPEDTFSAYRGMKKVINENTIITLIGGGNSGTLYEFIEWPRRFVLKFFRNCRIVSFPHRPKKRICKIMRKVQGPYACCERKTVV
jgi:pyruvyl transferase EpsI